MIILEGGSRPEKQDEAPPLPASLPTHSVLSCCCFAAKSPEFESRNIRCVPSFYSSFLPRFDESCQLPAWPAAGGLPARQDTVRAGVLAGVR